MEYYETPIVPVHPDVEDQHALDEYVIHKHGIDGFFILYNEPLINGVIMFEIIPTKMNIQCDV